MTITITIDDEGKKTYSTKGKRKYKKSGKYKKKSYIIPPNFKIYKEIMVSGNKISSIYKKVD